MGRDFWFYSGDAGIMSAAHLHLAAALAHIREPSPSLFRWQVWDVIEEGPFSPRGNVVPVPDSPGLGVTPDRQALASAAAHFQEHGPLSYYCDPALDPVLDPVLGRAYRRLPIA